MGDMPVDNSGNYKDIYESALKEWGKQNYDRSIGLLEESMRLAEMSNDTFFVNKALNEIEIKQKKINLGSMPRVIHVTLTSRCNMRCPFCYLDRYASIWDLPARVCEEIIDLFPYLQHLTWQGGEAFLHSSFRKMILKSIDFPNIRQTLLTNGSFLDEGWLDLFLKIPKFTIVISLESVKKETYEDLRKGGNFDRLKKNLRLINFRSQNNGNKFNLLINIIVMKRNYLEIEEMINFAIENKFNHIILTPLYANGSEFYDKEYLLPDGEEVREYFSCLMPRMAEKASRNNVYLDDRFTGIGKDRVASGTHVNYTATLDEAICLSPWQQLFIESTGEVKSYCSCVHNLGNLKDNSIKEIWNGLLLGQLRQNILNYDYRSCNPICVAGLLDKSNLRME